MTRIVDDRGYIVHPIVREAYDRICDRNERLTGVRSAEAFLRLVIRNPEKTIPLIGRRR